MKNEKAKMDIARQTMDMEQPMKVKPVRTCSWILEICRQSIIITARNIDKSADIKGQIYCLDLC